MQSPLPPKPTTAKVLIIGAGLGGLTLAALFERAGIDYLVFERAREVVPLGSAISIGANVMPFFEQIGIADALKAKSKPVIEGFQYNDKGNMTGNPDYRCTEERYGTYTHIVSRPLLYDIIASQVPKHKVRMGMKVLSYTQDEAGVEVRTWDNGKHRADILVGADGAYSAVRQTMYQDLEKQGKLPASDKEQLPFTNVCLVGTTDPLDGDKFPFLTKPESHFVSIVGEKVPYSWVYFSVPDNRICWSVIEHLNGETSRLNDSFRNTEWGPEAAEAMCAKVRDFAFPDGLSVGDLIDKTPKHLISKVMLEEKLFDTWHSGRTVLLGDACHKMHPSAGLGAVSAIHDAIVLASRLYELPSTSQEDIQKVFKDYKEERYPLAVKSYAASQQMSKLLAQKFINTVVRKVMDNLPTWLWYKVLDRALEYRPQATFLPLAPYKGLMPPSEQTSLVLAKKFPQKTVAC
ncbi:hypothetical protein BGZ51_006513 [Haplosporangium sp. Z 767]|nr:hypothetical protein BGZ51_006513 [Haplosporangium sp. Z 767]